MAGRQKKSSDFFYIWAVSSAFEPYYFLIVIVLTSVGDPDPQYPHVLAFRIRIHYSEVWIRIRTKKSRIANTGP